MVMRVDYLTANMLDGEYPMIKASAFVNVPEKLLWCVLLVSLINSVRLFDFYMRHAISSPILLLNHTMAPNLNLIRKLEEGSGDETTEHCTIWF